MKTCPACKQVYEDSNQNFCLNDGTTLVYQPDDAPPTLIMDRARTTQQNWNPYQPPATTAWQNQPLQTNENAALPTNQPFYPVQQYQSENQTLPIISLVTGIFGLLFACCYGGIPLGLAAVIIGYLGLKNYNENPSQYGGRGLAIAGMITGALGLVFSFGIILIAILSGL